MVEHGLPRGYESRSATHDDVPAITALGQRYDIALAGFSDFTEADLTELWNHPGSVIERDTWLVTERDQTCAYGMIWHNDPNKVLCGFGVVDLDRVGQGLGSFLVDRFEERAAEIHRHAGNEVTLWVFVDVNDDPAMRLLSSRNYQPIRRHYTMLMELPDEIPLDFVEGIEIRPTEDARLVHELLQDTFAEHWAHVPMSFEDWSRTTLERADIDPTLWWIAWQGPDPVGFLVGLQLKDLGYVSDLGVRTKARKRGIAQALLRRAFDEFRRRGLKQVSLGVDSQNPTGAVALYERVGMHVGRTYETFEKRFV